MLALQSMLAHFNMWPGCKTQLVHTVFFFFLKCRIIVTANEVIQVQLILRIPQKIWLHAPMCRMRVQRRASLCAVIEDHFWFHVEPSLQWKSAKSQRAESLDKSFYHTRGVGMNESCSLFHQGFIILRTRVFSVSINVMIQFSLPGPAEKWSEWNENHLSIDNMPVLFEWHQPLPGRLEGISWQFLKESLLWTLWRLVYI